MKVSRRKKLSSPLGQEDYGHLPPPPRLLSNGTATPPPAVDSLVTYPLVFSRPIIAPASNKSLAQSNFPARTALPKGVYPAAPVPAAPRYRSSKETPSSTSKERVSTWPAAAASCTGERAGTRAPCPPPPCPPPPPLEPSTPPLKDSGKGLSKARPSRL